MIRVLIVDDSTTVRYVLQTILESDPEIKVVGFAGNGQDAVRRAGELGRGPRRSPDGLSLIHI